MTRGPQAHAPRQQELRVPAGPEAPAKARAFVQALLRGEEVDADTEQRTLLVVSELVTNAVVHASRDGDEVHVSARVEPRRVVVTVSDAARGLGVPFVQSTDEERSYGRGLRLVELHADWSERISGGRREVCAEIHR